MSDVEPTNLCMTCRSRVSCFDKGISERESCDDYDQMPLSDLLARDRFIQGFMVGPCPRCGSEDTYDCENNPLVTDNTVGHCLSCEAYWCLECGRLFRTVEKGTTCPHWAVCDECSAEHGYLHFGTFVETICPACEMYENGCQLDFGSECERRWQYTCPHDGSVSDCPKVFELREK